MTSEISVFSTIIFHRNPNIIEFMAKLLEIYHNEDFILNIQIYQ